MLHLLRLRRAFGPAGILRTALAVLVTAFVAAGPALATDAAAEQNGLASDLVGQSYLYSAQQEDTLVELARRYGLGYTQIVAANPEVDPWLPGEGAQVVLPLANILPDASRKGIVINLAEQRLYYFPTDGGPVLSFAIGIGSEGRTTPLGQTTVVRKATNPTWYPPPSVRRERPELPQAVPPGDDNPLGHRALYLGWPAYLIHGTNRPYSIGRRASAGCIRLYPEDVEVLYDLVAVGTPVTVVDQPVKLGWSGGELYLQVHPSQTQADQIENTGRMFPEPYNDLEYRIVKAAGEDAGRLDWNAIRRAAQQRDGVAVRITRPLPQG